MSEDVIHVQIKSFLVKLVSFLSFMEKTMAKNKIKELKQKKKIEQRIKQEIKEIEEASTIGTYRPSVNSGNTKKTQGALSRVPGAEEKRESYIRELLHMGYTIYAVNPDEKKEPQDNQEYRIVDTPKKRRV